MIRLISAVFATASSAIAAKSFGGKSTPLASTTASSGPLDSLSSSAGSIIDETKATPR